MRVEISAPRAISRHIDWIIWMWLTKTTPMVAANRPRPEVAIAVADDRGRRLTFGGLAVIVGIWTLDALVEAAVPAACLVGAGRQGREHVAQPCLDCRHRK